MPAAMIVRGRWWFGAVCLGAALAGRVSAQSRETLETKVTVEGDRVILEWSAKHPWDPALQTSGVSLLAEYRTARGDVALDCLSNTGPASYASRGCNGVMGTRHRGPRERSLAFTLPASLTAGPQGAACLLFRMPDQRLLPIRRVDRDRPETARFRYPEWEAVARREGETSSLRRRVDEARAALAAKQGEITALEQRNAAKRWSSAAACEAIPAPDLDPGEAAAARPTVESGEREIVARQVCVMRARNAADELAGKPLLQRLGFNVLQPPSILDSVLALLPRAPGVAPSALSADRQQQLATYRRDYAQLAPNVPTYRKQIRDAGYAEPHFGSFGDFLFLQTITTQAGAAVASRAKSGEAQSREFVLGWVGGNLEAYSRCVDDGQTQLATSANAASELAARRPALQESARRALVKACNDDVGRLEALRAQLGPLELQVGAAERALAELRPPTGLPQRAREVNHEACVP
ncbi:MAG: hypothetical protein IPN47_20065 [Gemmatimonadetes bacterium]|nr:hypothetical protein [Gemmatimonadota bacterium]